MIINTKKVLLTIKGGAIKNEQGAPLTVGEALSNIMAMHKVGGKMKCYILAERLYKEGKMEVDEADFALIKEATEQSEAYTSNIVTGQLMRVLGDIKETKEVKTKSKK